jgi:hypothetical protein
MNDEEMDNETATPEERLLALLVGRWEGRTRTWFKPDELTDESPTRGSIRPILDGRFVLYEYKGTLLGEPMIGMAIYGYNPQQRRFEGMWIDTVHTDRFMLFNLGHSRGNGFAVSGRWFAGEEEWGWRTEFEFADPDHLIITMYNVTPAGEAYKGVETDLRRRRA